MINEKDKQQILNGEFAINRDGTKCKYIGLSCSILFPYMFASLDEEDRIIVCYHVTRAFTFCTDGQQRYDIVGLWKDKVRPFNLDKALEGHPVKLRNGCKAYVKYCLPTEYNGIYPVNGYVINPDINPNMETQRWNLAGKAWESGYVEYEDQYDIVSMWVEDESHTETKGNM